MSLPFLSKNGKYNLIGVRRVSLTGDIDVLVRGALCTSSGAAIEAEVRCRYGVQQQRVPVLLRFAVVFKNIFFHLIICNNIYFLNKKLR